MNWLVIQCSTICPHLCIQWGHRWDRVLYNYVMTPHMDMLIHCSTPWTIHPVYFQLHFHMLRRRMMFSQSSMCASRFSLHIIKDFWLNCHSTFSFSRYLNLTFTLIFALIILYWFSVNVKPSLQRHFTFDMLLHIEHWSLWLVTVMMYGRFHPQLLNVIRHYLDLSFITDNRETLWFSYMYTSSWNSSCDGHIIIVDW